VWTIGWGATGPDVKPGLTWTQDQADDRLDRDAYKYWAIALKASPGLALHPEIHEAIADFCYNLGGTKYRASTLKKRVDAEDWEGACEEIVKWVHGGGRKLPGLVKRRLAEREVIEENAP
jgi:lysozyme